MAEYCFGVDVGGTSVKMGLFDMEGTVLDKWEIPTRTEESGKKILPDIASSISGKIKDKGLDKSKCAGAGIGVPGPVDGNGVVQVAVNLGWGIYDVKKTLGDLLEMHIEAGNDANVAALGEMWKGGGEGYQNLVAVTLGTGVGGGIIINGQILTGSTGAAGEIGHVHVGDGEEDACNCGNKGCLEQYSSATGIVKLANKKLNSTDRDSTLRARKVSAKAVFDAVKAGDELAMEVAEEFGSYLGKALAAVAGTVNPEIFVIGGGVSRAGTIVLEYIKKYYEPNVFHTGTEMVFALATLGNDAGIYGAAKMVLSE